MLGKVQRTRGVDKKEDEEEEEEDAEEEHITETEIELLKKTNLRIRRHTWIRPFARKWCMCVC